MLVGQLANAMWSQFDHANEVDPNDNSDETLTQYVKERINIANKIAILKEVAEVDDTELVGIMKAICKQWIEKQNEVGA
ncbi:MAG: hypothetical protein J6U54_15970 [Clostridiales bacterium]|nr:hypothetical protein [Clostridiales bacterium]